MIRDKASAHQSQLEPALLMRHAEEEEVQPVEAEFQLAELAVSEAVAKWQVYESFLAAGRCAAGNRHLKCENPRPYWSTRVQLLNRRT